MRVPGYWIRTLLHRRRLVPRRRRHDDRLRRPLEDVPVLLEVGGRRAAVLAVRRHERARRVEEQAADAARRRPPSEYAHDVTPRSCTPGSSARNASFTAATSLSTVHDTSANVAPRHPRKHRLLDGHPRIAVGREAEAGGGHAHDGCSRCWCARRPTSSAVEEDRRDATIISADDTLCSHASQRRCALRNAISPISPLGLGCRQNSDAQPAHCVHIVHLAGVMNVIASARTFRVAPGGR